MHLHFEGLKLVQNWNFTDFLYRSPFKGGDGIDMIESLNLEDKTLNYLDFKNKS